MFVAKVWEMACLRGGSCPLCGQAPYEVVQSYRSRKDNQALSEEKLKLIEAQELWDLLRIGVSNADSALSQAGP